VKFFFEHVLLLVEAIFVFLQNALRKTGWLFRSQALGKASKRDSENHSGVEFHIGLLLVRLFRCRDFVTPICQF
jgi:hypothetical protein